MKTKFIGTIELGNEVTISDPCYDAGIWCAISFKDNLDGEWHCFLKEKDYGNWGVRNGEMIAYHKNYVSSGVKSSAWEYCGNVCVDSGTMSITDTIYYDNTHNNDDYSEEWYNREVCEKTCDNDHNIADNQSFIACSGIGDGSYGVYGAFDSEDRLYAVKVVFLD